LNKKVLTDIRAVTGFITAFMLSIASIIFALSDNQFWVPAIVISFVLLSFSVRRADKLYNEV
jgi:cation transport ATPase